MDLLSEIERLNSKIQQQQVLSKSDNGHASSSSETPVFPVENDSLISLKKRIASKSSDDGVRIESVNYF